MKTKLLLITSFFLLALNSCTTVKLVPDYSEKIENEIIETQKKNTDLYNELLALKEADRKYENFEKKYLAIESNINSIVFQTNQREKNVNFVVMTKNLSDLFLKYKEAHKEKTVLIKGEIESYKEKMDGLYAPMLMAEKTLKNIKK